jgi:hypothetical protein
MNSAKPSDWPAYQIGPRESIFAVGVVSVKFAELESVMIFMFATMLGLDLDHATKTASKIGTRTCLNRMSAELGMTDWPNSTRELVGCFVDGASACTDNRNYLMHSNIAWTGDENIVLFKAMREGNTTIAVPTLSELRRIADDMNEFVLFGRQLDNAINNTSSDIPLFPINVFPWPPKPREPFVLKFTSEAVALRKAY